MLIALLFSELAQESLEAHDQRERLLLDLQSQDIQLRFGLVSIQRLHDSLNNFLVLLIQIEGKRLLEHRESKLLKEEARLHEDLHGWHFNVTVLLYHLADQLFQ